MLMSVGHQNLIIIKKEEEIVEVEEVFLEDDLFIEGEVVDILDRTINIISDDNLIYHNTINNHNSIHLRIINSRNSIFHQIISCNTDRYRHTDLCHTDNQCWKDRRTNRDFHRIKCNQH